MSPVEYVIQEWDPPQIRSTPGSLAIWIPEYCPALKFTKLKDSSIPRMEAEAMTIRRTLAGFTEEKNSIRDFIIYRSIYNN